MDISQLNVDRQKGEEMRKKYTKEEQLGEVSGSVGIVCDIVMAMFSDYLEL